MLVETSVGVEPCSLCIIANAVERRLVVRRGEIPVTAPVVDRPELVLETRQDLVIGYRSCGLVARHRGVVLAEQRERITNRFVEERLLGMAERQSGAEMAGSLGVRIEASCPLTRETEVLGGL